MLPVSCKCPFSELISTLIKLTYHKSAPLPTNLSLWPFITSDFQSFLFLYATGSDTCDHSHVQVCVIAMPFNSSSSTFSFK